MNDLLNVETLAIELLLIISVVAIGVRRLRVPYTVALVLVGLLFTFQETIKVELTPELILILFVPPLVFEAAFHLDANQLRNNLVPILILAVPGVLLTTAIVGFLVSFGVNIPLAPALVFGALIAATDPVAVVALFRALGAPRKLSVLVEGESLFNDGTAIVVYSIMLAAALPAATAAHAAAGDQVLVGYVIDFFRVAVGGLLVGGIMGWVTSILIGRLDDYLIEITLTTVLAFGSYLLAERFHVSGVLAVVAAGILNGNMGPRGMSPTTRIMLFNFWEYLAFVANSFVFLLIGFEINVPRLVDNIVPIVVAVVAVIASRGLVVYGLNWVAALFRNKISRAYQHVQFWGGLRGAISLALVLSLPATLQERELLRVMAFGVVLFTLLVQGTTMNLLLSRLGLVERGEAEIEYQRRHGRLMAARAAYERLNKLHNEGMISATTWEQLSPRLETRITEYLGAQRELLASEPGLQQEETIDALREALRAERAMLASLLSNGVISEHVFEELATKVDEALQNGDPRLAFEDAQESATLGIEAASREQDNEAQHDRQTGQDEAAAASATQGQESSSGPS